MRPLKVASHLRLSAFESVTESTWPSPSRKWYRLGTVADFTVRGMEAGTDARSIGRAEPHFHLSTIECRDERHIPVRLQVHLRGPSACVACDRSRRKLRVKSRHDLAASEEKIRQR